jgi:diguanylate cyclase (GGDEF)-like protein/PAS domain S-box-containing protein
MSLKNKLFLLIISLSTIALIISSYITLEVVEDIFHTQRVKDIAQDKKIIDATIKNIKENTSEISKQIASDEDIVNSLNLISNYENPVEYIPEIYDFEKRAILENTQKWIKESDNYTLTIFDKEKNLILINRKHQSKKDFGYVSYSNGAKKFTDYFTKEFIKTPFVLNVNNTDFSFYQMDNEYFIKFTTPVVLDSNIIGFVRVGYSLNSDFITFLNNKLGTLVVLKSKDKYIYDNQIDSIELNKRLNSDDYFVEEHTVIDDAISLKSMFIFDQKRLHSQLTKTYLQVFLVWILILVITFFVSFRFIKRVIVEPLDNLKESIKNIKNNKYDEIKIDKYDEISGITRDFNKLSKTLQDNISFLNSYKSVMDEGSIVTKSDLKGNITYANDNFYKVTGYSKKETIGSPHNIVRDPTAPKSVFENLWKTIKSKKVWKGILKNKKKDGSFYWVDIVIQPILNSKEEIIEYIAVRHEITELVKQREKLNDLVSKDLLTNLGNRFKLTNDIKNNSKNSIAILNVDNFRQVNDFYGHIFGDKLIKKISKILSSLIASQDQYKLYRLQGDEFVILTEQNSNDLFYDRVRNIVNFISNDNIEVDAEQLSVKLTAAISYEANDKILQTADMALQIARKKNIDIVIYSEDNSLNKEYENNLKWTKKIKIAIEEDRVVPFFQPIVNNLNNSNEKYESLIRILEDDKVISPYFFLEISKKTKYYNMLTKIMLEKSFKMFYDKEFEFSVNLTIDDILNVEIQDYIFELLNKYGIGKRVVFEIVESESIENFNQVVSFIRNVKGFGCKIAIDDFGTGYSNFEYLMKLEADYIKIDGSMIKNIDTDNNAKMVVETIVNFAKKMNMKTIAEFVENEEILKIVNELGIDYSQGYYFSAPKPELD